MNTAKKRTKGVSGTVIKPYTLSKLVEKINNKKRFTFCLVNFTAKVFQIRINVKKSDIAEKKRTPISVLQNRKEDILIQTATNGG